MKKLMLYLEFMLQAFLNGKVLTVTSCGPAVHYETKAHEGTKVEVVITKDDTLYPPSKDGSNVTNLFEKFTIKVPKDISIPIGSTVEIVNGVGTVYGDFRNKLSVKADDIKVITPPAQSSNGGGKA